MVEAVLTVCLVLAPLAFGVIKFGGIIERQQDVDLVTQVPQTDANGTPFVRQYQNDCSSLGNRIRDAFAASLMRTNHDLFKDQSTLTRLLVTSVQSIPDSSAAYVSIGWDPVLLKAWAAQTGNENLAMNLNESAARIENAWWTTGSGNCRVVG